MLNKFCVINQLPNIFYINARTVHVCVCVCLCMCVSVCVCLSVCRRQDLRNETSYCHASFASVKRFSWQVAQTAFQAYTTCV